MAARSPQHAALGAAIRALRKRRRLSQERLALEVGCERGYMGKIERGEGNPTFGLMLRIASALQVRPSTLLEHFERRAPAS